jgi:hypothetical protein
MCDPKHDGCKQTYIDCSKDHELGHVFDSCFTYQMVMVRPDGSNFTHLDKNCSISEGCKALKNYMCEKYNYSLEGAVRRCDIQCCNRYDYCNAGEPNFDKTDLPTYSSSYTPTHSTGHHVLGYKSTASSDRVESWKLFLGMFCVVVNYVMGCALL